MRGILEALAAELKIHGLIDVEEAFTDGSFAPSKKGAPSGCYDRRYPWT
jgi:hypothetical protein